MNVPPNTRPFDLSLAQQNHPLVTRAGATAKFIAYVPENPDFNKLCILVEGEFLGYFADGVYTREIPESDNVLFLAPLGYCEGLPVFAGDVLCWGSDKIKVTVDDGQQFLSCKWPSKAPVVETKYSQNQLFSIFHDTNDDVYPALIRIANKAIERSIADGDVIASKDAIPTSVVKKIMKEMTQYDWELYSNDADEIIENLLKEYLENLK